MIDLSDGRPAYRMEKGRTDGVFRAADFVWIPNDPANPDWQEYQAWVAAGGVTEIVDMDAEPGPDPGGVMPGLPTPLRLEADPRYQMDATTKRYVDDYIAALAHELGHQPPPPPEPHEPTEPEEQAHRR